MSKPVIKWSVFVDEKDRIPHVLAEFHFRGEDYYACAPTLIPDPDSKVVHELTVRQAVEIAQSACDRRINAHKLTTH